ncbi:glycosyltransferase [Planktomarina temperata]|nr:glycosyltransferase [Planktomarina temperata]
MNDYKYSVLMSIYLNDELSSVMRSAESIRGQKIKANDVVVVLDGPVKLDVERYISKTCFDWNIIKIPENVGLGDALRIGLTKCKNKWVMRMDADDTCSPYRSERLLEALAENNDDKIAAIGSYISEHNSKTRDTKLIKYPLKYRTNGKMNYFRDPIGHASAIINRDAVLEVGGYKRCIYFEDTYLWLRLLRRGYYLLTVPEPLYEATVDSEFYSRRSGVRYAFIELHNFLLFYRENLITNRSFLQNIILRPIVRLLPKLLVKKIYLIFLRTNTEKV